MSRIESNDVDLMVTVAANAARCGYLLVGAAERVYARTDADDRVARVPRYEEDAVHQLLRRRWLTLGATHRVTCGAAQLVGTAVLVPKATRERIERWNRLHRPPSWPDQHRRRTRHPTPPGSRRPVSRVRAVPGHRPRPRLPTNPLDPRLRVHRPDTTSPCHWCARQSSPPRRPR